MVVEPRPVVSIRRLSRGVICARRLRVEGLLRMVVVDADAGPRPTRL